ncbi:hypothetical protein KY328_03585 [Candidatus Woesearchaeota archaeon]|nr:hypothetical protein [Candidatus Woesearchaeota archaeon]MBW3021977.1 hypothetical protein [Candidatus Woesearchaeota archaeon]
MDYNLLIGIGAFLATYYTMRYLFFRRAKKVIDVEKDLSRILDNDEYKVKGRFE